MFMNRFRGYASSKCLNSREKASSSPAIKDAKVVYPLDLQENIREEKIKRETTSQSNSQQQEITIEVKDENFVLVNFTDDFNPETNDCFDIRCLQEMLEESQLDTSASFYLHIYIEEESDYEVQALLAEIAMVEEEIIFLEREVAYLKLSLYQGLKHKKERNLQQEQHQQLGNRHHPHFLCRLIPSAEINRYMDMNERNTSLKLISETRDMTCRKINDEEAETSRRNRTQNKNISLLADEVNTYSENKLSEELLKNMISIFHMLNKKVTQANCESDIFPKLPCMSSRSFIRKSSTNCKIATCSSNYSIQMLDPFIASPETDGTSMDMGSYKNFIHFTRSSLDMSRISLCHPAIITLRVLMDKLSTVELSSMTYKQKLAFWINIYNACIMHAFLLHGLPPSADKPLILLNKAAVNVGGIVLNALAIEHYILRPARTTQNMLIDKREAFLRHAYGLGYPEPNVTFALCRGSWSSPALRVYTTESVVNELEKAKVEYLEASVGVTNKKKIFMPKLLHKHMQDFADDIESLLEWIYSQLPRSGSLKGSILSCLTSDRKVPLSKLVEIQPDDDEFRYLLPSISRPLTDTR